MINSVLCPTSLVQAFVRVKWRGLLSGRRGRIRRSPEEEESLRVFLAESNFLVRVLGLAVFGDGPGVCLVIVFVPLLFPTKPRVEGWYDD